MFSPLVLSSHSYILPIYVKKISPPQGILGLGIVCVVGNGGAGGHILIAILRIA